MLAPLDNRASNVLECDVVVTSRSLILVKFEPKFLCFCISHVHYPHLHIYFCVAFLS